MSNKENINTHLSRIDPLVRSAHHHILQKSGGLFIFISIFVYVIILLFFGDYLKIACNYFVLFPLLASAFVYGIPGGTAAGFMALPANLLIFYLMDRVEYAPRNLYIAELSGILVGMAMGYQSEYFSRLVREIENRKKTEQRLREILTEKDMLFREVNHRVRNNLSIINSLIQLHANRVNDSAYSEECGKLKDRIFSISLIHEQLFLENQPLILDLPRYIDVLLKNMVSSFEKHDLHLKTKWPGCSIVFSSEKVLYLGLIVHEVVMNSLKHGVIRGIRTELTVALQETDEETLTLTIRDNGPGFNPGSIKKGLGTRLINTLSQQLEGKYRWINLDGTAFYLDFKKGSSGPDAGIS